MEAYLNIYSFELLNGEYVNTSSVSIFASVSIIKIHCAVKCDNTDHNKIKLVNKPVVLFQHFAYKTRGGLYF